VAHDRGRGRALPGPLARLAGWQGERYGIFITGRSGSLKTSVTQALMAIYGAGFLEDEFLLKLGEGATRNAVMGYAAQAHDMPFFLDNFKANTGDGARGLVNLVHNLLEGGDRERMLGASELKESRPIHCWPIFTGEDVPDGDPATLARAGRAVRMAARRGQLPAGPGPGRRSAPAGRGPRLARLAGNSCGPGGRSRSRGSSRSYASARWSLYAACAVTWSTRCAWRPTWRPAR
jgi:hypothetical protein